MTSTGASIYSSAFFERIHDQLKPFENLSIILCKVELDTTLHSLTVLFTQIFEKELFFSFRGFFIRISQYQRKAKKHRLHVSAYFKFEDI